MDVPWATNPTHFIKIFTPVTPAEVGTSQRHDGTWNKGYRRTHALQVWERSVWLDGLALEQARVVFDAGDPNFENRAYAFVTGNQGSDIRVSNCLSHVANAHTWNRAFDVYESYAEGSTPTTVTIWNSIGITDDTDIGDDGAAFLSNSLATVTFYSCTGIATGTGWGFFNDFVGTSTATMVNCLANTPGGTGFGVNITASALPMTISYSASNDATLADPIVNYTPGANNQIDQTLTFAGGSDYHLSTAAGVNPGVRGTGANLTNDAVQSFADDIDGQSRPTPPDAWDIGADQTP